jgi:hypothetical protein
MSQVGGPSPAGQSGDAQDDDDDDDDGVEASYRWRVHVHVPEAGPAVAAIRALGEPSDISVSQLALPRDPGAPESPQPHES